MEQPLVSVICLCHNHERFIREAIRSVMEQTYTRIEVIVVDDASTDNSVAVIRELQEQFPSLEILLLDKNVGNCAAFNRGLALATGTYVIDLATDDVLLPHRIENGVAMLEKLGNNYSTQFSDALYINEKSETLYRHSDRYPHDTIPAGDIYTDVIRRYFICTPTLMMRRNLLMALGGFDEELAYEDFDYLIRASRVSRFCYAPEVLVKRRLVSNSLSSKQGRLFSQHERSTYEVCLKIFTLNRNQAEQRALAYRAWRELLSNIKMLNLVLAADYALLWLRCRMFPYR